VWSVDQEAHAERSSEVAVVVLGLAILPEPVEGQANDAVQVLGLDAVGVRDVQRLSISPPVSWSASAKRSTDRPSDSKRCTTSPRTC
jgi:hypothetical protein